MYTEATIISSLSGQWTVVNQEFLVMSHVSEFSDNQLFIIAVSLPWFDQVEFPLGSF